MFSEAWRRKLRLSAASRETPLALQRPDHNMKV